MMRNCLTFVRVQIHFLFDLSLTSLLVLRWVITLAILPCKLLVDGTITIMMIMPTSVKIVCSKPGVFCKVSIVYTQALTQCTLVTKQLGEHVVYALEEMIVHDMCSVAAVFILIYSINMAACSVRASRVMHFKMLENILRSPMAFFETTPTGRILNRFSQDVETIDNILPQLIRLWINTTFTVASTVVVISYSTPIFLVMFVPLAVLYYLIQVGGHVNYLPPPAVLNEIRIITFRILD